MQGGDRGGSETRAPLGLSSLSPLSPLKRGKVVGRARDTAGDGSVERIEKKVIRLSK